MVSTSAWHAAFRTPARSRRIPRCKNLAPNIIDCVSLCLSDETLKADRPFYLSMPGEIKYPTQGVNMLPVVERDSSVVECRTRKRESPGSNPLCYCFEVWAFSFSSRRLSRLSCINEYLAIDSGGHVGE